MEEYYQPLPTETIDLIDQVTDKGFLLLVEGGDSRLAQIGDDEAVADVLIEQYEDAFKSMFGDYYNSWAGITAFAYETDDDAIATDETVLLNTQEIVFRKITVARIHDIWRTVLEFQDKDDYDDEGNRRFGAVHYVLPEALLAFEVRPQEEFQDVTARHAMNSLRVTNHKDFLHGKFKNQSELLDYIAMAVDDDLEVEEGTVLKMEAVRFLALYDEMDMSLQDMIIDQSDIPYDDRIVLVGAYLSPFFPETMGRQQAFRSKEDFFVGGGVPCIVLRNDMLCVTYFIPLNAIENVIFEDNEYEEDV